jgi:hypothetical protein
MIGYPGRVDNLDQQRGYVLRIRKSGPQLRIEDQVHDVLSNLEALVLEAGGLASTVTSGRCGGSETLRLPSPPSGWFSFVSSHSKLPYACNDRSGIRITTYPIMDGDILVGWNCSLSERPRQNIRTKENRRAPLMVPAVVWRNA